MATLYLDHGNRTLQSLREWLDGHWGLLLSHPVDFENQSLERDRWLEIVRRQFQASSVRPIACRPDRGEVDRGWISVISADEQRVRLIDPRLLDLSAHRLREAIQKVVAERFVVVVDPSLSHRFLLTYAPPNRTISPFDLLSAVSARRRHLGSAMDHGAHSQAA